MLDYSHVDPFDEEDWNEKEPELLEYRIFYYKDNTDYLFIGGYYDNGRIILLSNDGFSPIFIFDYDNIKSDKLSTHLVNSIMNDDVWINIPGGIIKKKWAFSDIKKFLDPNIEIVFA